MEYQDQYKHPEWQKKRLEVLELRKFTCQDCGATEKELHVHHPFYTKGKMVWEYDTSVLMCLCNECHEFTHLMDNAIKETIFPLNRITKSRILGYLHAVTRAPMQHTGGNYRYGFLEGVRGDNDRIMDLLDREAADKL